MYKITELNEYIEDSDLTLSARVGEDENDIVLTVNCQEWCVTKKDIGVFQRWLRAVLKEAE
jgi:hypothetical protein